MYEFHVDTPLPGSIKNKLKSVGSYSCVDLPSQVFILGLDRVTHSDIEAFLGPARFGVGLRETFMVLSPIFKGFTFDVLWSPNIAAATGEPAMPDPKRRHLLFHFVLTDTDHVVKAIRSATISPECGEAIYRATQTLREEDHAAHLMNLEMQSLFTRYPHGFDDGFFHETCALGD